MSSKLGLILSLVFVAMFFMLGMDLMSIQYIYGDLDAKGVAISYNISKAQRTDTNYLVYLENQYGVQIEDVTPSTVGYGDVVQFVLRKDYQPIVVSNNVMSLRVKRSAVIGFYG